MEVKNKKWLKYIGRGRLCPFDGDSMWVYTTVQKDQKQNEAKTVQTTENTTNIAVVTKTRRSN